MVLLAAGLAHSAGAEALTPDEFRAVTLAKVSPYVQWPKKASADTSTNFVVGIFGTNTVEPMLVELLKGKKVDGRDVVVKTFASETNVLPRCQLLFIPATQEAQWLLLSTGTNTFGLLTVGESEGFTTTGGVFNLLVAQQKLEINTKNAKKAGLEINSHLLKFAKVIK